MRRHLWRLPPASVLHIDDRRASLGERDRRADTEGVARDEPIDTRSFSTGFDYPPSRNRREPSVLDMIAPSDMPEQRPALYLSPCAVARRLRPDHRAMLRSAPSIAGIA